MNFSIPSAEFSHIINDSKSLVSGDLSFRYAPRYRPALGLIVSKYYGNAVARNLFKRRCRSLFRIKLINRGVLISLIVRPKKQGISFFDLEASFVALYKKYFI